ncbi:uncharacterized protein N7469_009558 [Penicillium citrinum]|uniref:Uncharacterized protein n=2 Tax=Penicillium TaxID=5073 RepID=A0A9W9TFE2_PENCI|nr:uncharacterized protein N7469_009558 [Penicillium citrinum]KAJ5220671.1 hypothetical protein N7469_009558 [Penicillium citrinum]KAJ5595681.1 hypothetical protein N7450_002139 [Penicillium hetheringtonii]
MHFAKAIGMGSVALVSFMQVCPAPWEAIAPLVGGVISGSIAGGMSKSRRDFTNFPSDLGDLTKRDLPAGVSQESFDQCKQQINDQGPGNPVNVYSTGADSARADNVPAACMDLATVFLSNPSQDGGPVPTPMGSASLEYTGLSAQDKTDLQNALSANQ